MWHQEKPIMHRPFQGVRLCKLASCLHHPRVNVMFPRDTFTVGLTKSPTPHIARIKWHIPRLLTSFRPRKLEGKNPCTALRRMTTLNSHISTSKTGNTLVPFGYKSHKVQTASTKSHSTRATMVAITTMSTTVRQRKGRTKATSHVRERNHGRSTFIVSWGKCVRISRGWNSFPLQN